MAVSVQDVLKANLVLAGVRLLSSQEEQARFGQEVGTDVSGAVAGIAVEIPLAGPQTQTLELGQTLTLARDRITLELVQDQTTISIEYPSRDQLDKLASISILAIRISDISNHDLRAVGFNLEVVYQQTSGLSGYEFLAKRVFTPDLFQSSGYRLRGGSANLRFTRGDEIWNIVLEPRFGNPRETRLFASFNLHQNTSRMPKPDSIKPTLENVWDQAHLIMSHFD